MLGVMTPDSQASGAHLVVLADGLHDVVHAEELQAQAEHRPLLVAQRVEARRAVALLQHLTTCTR